MKPKLFVIPRYIAPLKYFEKLIPALSEHFEIIIAPLEDRGMLAYCRERGIPATNALIVPQKAIRFPFISHLLDEERFLQRASVFLAREKPAVLLTETAIPERARALFEAARARGARTVALQWCQASQTTARVRLSLRNRLRRMVARHGGAIRALMRETYFAFLRVMFVAVNAVTGSRYHRQELFVDALGVIDERAKDVFAERGFPPERMNIVGFADATLIAVLKHRLATDTTWRRRRERIYGIESDNKTILIIPTMFHAGGATVAMTPDGQVRYYRTIIESVRGIYAQGEANVLFKIHPRDTAALYEPLIPLGVRLVGNEGDIEELVLMSNLVIAHPLTAANFTIVLSGTPALFINFSSVAYLNEGKELYGLHEIITAPERFRELLGQFRNGALPLQYKSSAIPHDSLARIVALVRGDA